MGCYAARRIDIKSGKRPRERNERSSSRFIDEFDDFSLEEFGVEMSKAYPRMLAHLDAERARNKASLET
jgi:hypothetical protein